MYLHREAEELELLYYHMALRIFFYEKRKDLPTSLQWVSSEFMESLTFVNTTRRDFDWSTKTMRLFVGLTNKARGDPGSILVWLSTN